MHLPDHAEQLSVNIASQAMGVVVAVVVSGVFS